jgi:hypothetical protein
MTVSGAIYLGVAESAKEVDRTLGRPAKCVSTDSIKKTTPGGHLRWLLPVVIHPAPNTRS